MKPVLYILLAFCVLWRLCVPTVVDLSATSLCKDFSHGVVFFVFGWTSFSIYIAVKTRKVVFTDLKDGLRPAIRLHVAAWGVSAFELLMALFTKGPFIP